MADNDTNNPMHQAVAGWVAEGVDLATLQVRIRESFNQPLTYMEVRFLIDDLGLELIDPKAQKADATAAAESADAKTEATPAAEDAIEPEVMDGGVHVEVDGITRPGSVISGTVTFSDGKSMGWQLDAMGQLGLIPGNEPDYRPSAEDISAFQSELQSVLSKKGLY
jgi:hypothetical protein